DVEREMLAAELRADAGGARPLKHPSLQLDVAEAASVAVAGGRQPVEVLGGGELDGLQARLGGGAADDEDKVVRRASGGAEADHFLEEEFLEAARAEQRLGFLIQVGL